MHVMSVLHNTAALGYKPSNSVGNAERVVFLRLAFQAMKELSKQVIFAENGGL